MKQPTRSTPFLLSPTRQRQLARASLAALMSMGAVASAGGQVSPSTQPGNAAEPAAQTRPATEPLQPLAAPNLLEQGRLQVDVGDSRIVRLSRPVSRVSIPNPEIADVTLLEPDVMLVNARSTGITQFTFWDNDNRMETIDVEVETDLREVQEKLELLLPGRGITAVDLNGRIALRGRVSDLAIAEQAETVASSYGDVSNFIEVTGVQQVMLEIRFAEVSKTAAKQLGLNLGLIGQDGAGQSNIGGVNPFNPGLSAEGNIVPNQLSTSSTASPAVTLFGGGVIGDVTFEAFLSALRENNLLRVLAEPNLTILSGEPGEFLAGGRIPIPVPQEEGIAIQYESYGIRLRALPVVLGDGRIRVRVEPEVSDLDRANGVTVGGVSVPGFTVRRLETEVELVDGQTFVLAGLLNSSVSANKQATPLLGDVPILGALFRSTRYQRAETELVILITPRLVSPLDPDEVPPLPGEAWKHPNDIELFLWGDLGGPGPEAADAAKEEPRLEASYSYLPVEPAAD